MQFFNRGYFDNANRFIFQLAQVFFSSSKTSVVGKGGKNNWNHVCIVRWGLHTSSRSKKYPSPNWNKKMILLLRAAVKRRISNWKWYFFKFEQLRKEKGSKLFQLSSSFWQSIQFTCLLFRFIYGHQSKPKKDVHLIIFLLLFNVKKVAKLSVLSFLFPALQV